MRLMDKMLLDSVVATTVHRERNRQQVSQEVREELRRSPEQLWRRIADEVTSVPEHQRLRLRLADEREGHAVDSTHPPTHLRRTSLALSPSASPQVVVDEVREHRIDAELAAARRTVARWYLTAS